MIYLGEYLYKLSNYNLLLVSLYILDFGKFVPIFNLSNEPEQLNLKIEIKNEMIQKWVTFSKFWMFCVFGKLKHLKSTTFSVVINETWNSRVW